MIPSAQLDLLRAESQWILPQLAHSERVLWLGPAPQFSDSTQPPPWLRLCVTPAGQLGGDIQASLDRLPLLDDAMDQVVLQHPLESGLALEPLLAEAVRVLKPECTLWLFASGAFSRSRSRLVSALAPTQARPLRFSPLQAESALRELGCAEIARMQFSTRVDAGELRSWARWLPLPPLTVLRARKRRSATTLRLRDAELSGAAQLAGVAAYPATRVSLAA